MELPKPTQQTPKEPNEEEVIQIIHAIYLNTISKQIRLEADLPQGEFRKPIDLPAYRVGCEYVAQYFSQKLMTNTLELASKESDNYVRTRHDENWLAKKLRLDETKDLFTQLLDCCVPNWDNPQSQTGTSVSGRKMKPKQSRGLGTGEGSQPGTLQSKTQTTTGDVQFIESNDFSQFTNVLTTGVGATYTAREDTVIPATGMTFTQLDTTQTTETEETYDPRGVKAKPKPLPKISKMDVVKSNFKAHEFDTMQTMIDTINNTEDYQEHKRLRNELKAAGIINRDVTVTTTFGNTTQTQDSFLQPKPRYPQETIDTTWQELEEPPTDPTLLIGQCPFAKDFKDIVSRKKKLVSMGMQTTHQVSHGAQAEPNIAPAPPLSPDLMGALSGPMNAAAAPPDVRQEIARQMLDKEEHEIDPHTTTTTTTLNNN